MWDTPGDAATRVQAGWLVCMSSCRLGELAGVIHAGEGALGLLEAKGGASTWPGSASMRALDLNSNTSRMPGRRLRH